MPIFDNELIDNAPNRENKVPDVTKASPDTREISTGMGGFEKYLGTQVVPKSGVTLDDLAKINVANPTSWDSPVQMIPTSERLANNRYAMYERGIDLENVYGLSQGWMKQLANGVVKMGATAAGTFLQSFATIPNTINAIRHGKASELAGNPDSYEASIDNWLKNVENYFPNYYTRHEREHPFLAAIPGFAGSANFWGDQVIKNIGFTVGAIGGALAQDAIIGAATQGIGDIPLISAQIGKAALWLNKLFTGTRDVEKVLEVAKTVGQTESQILNLKRLQELAAGTKVANGFRYMMNLYGSARTEAGVEARDGYRQVKDELLKQYKLEHLGEEPSGDDLAEIDKFAEDAMNIRFGINMAILSVSNAIQFDNILKSYGAAKKGLTGTITKDVEDLGKVGLAKGSLDTFERKAPEGISGKIWDVVKPKLPVMFSEGVYEEGGQYAAERGTYDYYTRKYKNLNNPENKETWNTLDEIIKSTNYGLMEQFGSDEGKQNMLVGAISALITNGLMGRIDAVKGKGKEARLQYAVNTLNQYGLTGILSDKYTDTLNTVGIVKEMQEAVKSGNIYQYKNLKHDMFFNFVNSRIRIGMHDVTLEQLSMLKDLSKEDFEKTFGVEFDEAGRKTVNSYVDALMRKANAIKANVDALDNTFKNPFKNITNPLTDEEAQEAAKFHVFNSWKTDLAYYTSIASDVNERLQSIQSDLAQINPLLTNELISTLTDKESLKESSRNYEERAKQILETLSPELSPLDRKRARDKAKAFRTMSERINLAMNNNKHDIKDFASLLNFELNNQDETKDDVLSLENIAKIVEYGTDINKLHSLKKRANDIFTALADKKGFDKYFEQANTIASQEEPKVEEKPVKKEPEEIPFQIGREYEAPEIKPAKISKIADDRYQVEAPDGSITFYPSQEKADEAADEINEDFASRNKVKVLAINPDGTVKVEDSTGNIQNVSPSTLKGYNKIITEQERLTKDKEQLEKLEKELEYESGNVGTNTPAEDKKISDDESYIKSVEIYHSSSVSESEDLHDPSQSAPHVQRSREFLNNVKDYKNNQNFGAILVTANNEESLGLKGLTELSYHGNDMSTSKDVDTGFVAQVFVERADGKIFFIDSKGERIGEINNPTDINRVVFQTMPTTATHYDGIDSKGKPYHIPRFRKEEEDAFMERKEIWKLKRVELLSGNTWDGKFYKFRVSRGIPILDLFEGNSVKHHVGGILVPENKIERQEGLVTISVTGTISHQGENIKFPKGRPVLQYFDTLQFLNNNKFSNSEAKTIYRIIKELANDILEQSKKNKHIELNKRYISFLQNLLYFRKDSKTINNQIFIDTNSMSISLAGKLYPISEIAERENDITDQLLETYHNVNNTTLAKKFAMPFYELYLDDEGNIQEREWTNYQTYLLSSKNPDGSSRSIDSTPLYTNVAPQTDTIQYSYVQKYSTLIDLELPRAPQVKKEESPAVETPIEAPKIGEYVLDGKTVNTFKGKTGEVTFTAEIDENDNISIEATIPQEILDKTGLTAKQISGNITAVLTKARKESPSGITETKTEKTIPEEVQKKKPDVQFPDDEYRRVGVGEEEIMTDAEIELFKQWHQENVPNIPYEILSNIIATYDGESAWGVFENGVAKFYRGAIKGTEYHEVFEGIWKAFLSESEKEAILNEFKTRKGSFIDRATKKKIDFADATDLQAKERIADDFADYRLGKLPARTLGERIRRFFKAIIDFFKSFISNPSLKEQLFKSIDKSRFKEARIVPQVVKEGVDFVFEQNPELSKIGTPQQYSAYLDSIFPESKVKDIVYRGSDDDNLKGSKYSSEVYFTPIKRGAEFYKISNIYTAILNINNPYFAENFGDMQKNIPLENDSTLNYNIDKIDKDFFDYNKRFNYYYNKNKNILDSSRLIEQSKMYASNTVYSDEHVKNFNLRVNSYLNNFLPEIKIKSKEQIYIIGSQEDIEGFKNWVKQEPQYSKIEGITETQAFEYVQDMTARIAQYIIYEEDKKSLYDLKKITGEELYNYVKDLYKREGKYDFIGEKAFEQLWKRTKENLQTLGLRFSSIDRLDINDDNISNRSYAPEAFTVDWKKNSSFAIKFTCATMPQVKPTNQQNATSLVLPKRDFSSVKGYKLNNFNRIFATLMDKLSNTTDVKKVETKLLDLAKYDADFVRFFQRVGGLVGEENKSAYFDFSNFKNEDWRLFVDFYQTFTKQRPNALIQYINGSEVHTAPANQYTAAREIENKWFENIKAMSKDKKSVIVRNSTKKVYEVNKHAFPTNSPRSAEGMISFLKTIGVEFSLEAWTKLKPYQQTIFAKAVGSIYTYLQTTDNVGSIKGRTLTINEQLSSLSNLLVTVTNPNQENTYFGVEGTRHQSNEENNAPSLFENEFNESSTLDELLTKRPELNDIFSSNSIILKKGGVFFDKEGNRIKDIKVSYIQGQNDLNKRRGLSTRKVSFSDGLTMEINQNLSGNYYILIPGDSSTEWMLNMGNPISYTDISFGRAWSKVYNIFNGYLRDEIALALDYRNREHLKIVKNRAKELRFFKDILSSKELNGINSLIKEEASQEEINEYLAQHSKEIEESIKSFIMKSVNDTRKLLVDNDQLYNVREDTFAYPKLDNRFANDVDVSIKKFVMTESDVNNTLTFATINYMINNIEFHKILFGDPYQFAIKAGKLEETKRVKSFISPRRTTFDSPEYNTFLNTEYNKAGDIQLEPKDPGYHQHKSYASTVTLEDVRLSTNNYDRVVETDAFSLIMDNAHREVMLKNGQWSTEAEEFHQWQMAYTRAKLAQKGQYEYTNPALKEHDKEVLSKPEPEYAFNIIKPIVSGAKANKNIIDVTLHKFSQMPLYYKMAEGKNLGKFYLKMMKENRDYAVFETGQKVGTEQLHSLYNEDGSFNESPFNNLIEVPWRIYGLQLNTVHEDEGHQTRGSQITKLISIDLFDNGEPIGDTQERKDTIKQLYEYNKEILDKMHTHAYNTILKKLGVEDTGIHFFTPDNLVDTKAISETLEYELLRRELSENAKDTIQLDENGKFRIPFEASTSYKQIKDIIYSIIHKTLVAPKVSGGMHIQAPAVLWEDAAKGRGLIIKTDEGYKRISKEEYKELSDEDKKKVRLSSDNLKFYKKENPYCEVMIPHWFKDKFDKRRFPTDESILNYLNGTSEGREILKGIAFRIPTQSLSSVEAFRVKAFLPKSMGDTIVVPSEITAKTGSDFDIDKLNMYLKSVYVDRNGDVRLIRYLGSEEATKEFYNGVYSDTIEKKIQEAEKHDEFRDMLLTVFTKIESLEDFSILDIKRTLTPEEYRFYYNHLNMIQEIIDQASDKEISVADYITGQIGEPEERKSKISAEFFNYELRDDYVDSMYKKALENEYYSSMEKLLTLPENFDRLLSSVDNDILISVANKLNSIRGKGDESLTSNLISRNFMASVRHAFLAAKQWIGIGAVNNTSHSLMQKSKIYLDPKRINKLDKADRAIIGNGLVILPHNTVNINGEERLSLSRTHTADGKQLISSRLSAYITSFVDAVNNPYIADIISSDLLVSTFMFLERIGAGERVPMFMNQPIITEYVKYLDGLGYKYLYKKANIDYILSKFPTSVESAIDVNALEENITKYYTGKLSDSDNAVQQKIFWEFLKYSKMAEHSFELTQAFNYDTTKFKNSDAYSRKNTKTKVARDKNIFISVDNVLEDTFIGEEKKLLDLAMDSVGAIIKLEQDDFTHVTGEVIEPFEMKRISQDDFEKVASRVKNSFLDYIIQIKSGLNKEITALMSGENSIGRQIASAKKKHPELKILNELQIVSSDREDGAQTIKLTANIRDAYDENVYTEMMRELKDIEPELFNTIVKVAILQGSYQSALSIKNIIPVEEYSKVIKPIIDSLTLTKEIRDFSKGMFQRNNWKNDDIVPTMTPYFKLASELPNEDAFGNDIYQYYSPAFPNLPALNLKSKDRKILILNPMYNPLESSSDFIKVPRVITLKNSQDQIDLVTGQSIPGIRFVQMKKTGDLSLRDIYGYQKVKYSDGTPLRTNKGEFVYKLINLWGDGQLLSEYYTEFHPSAIHNGTARIENEIPDADIINFYAPIISEKKIIPPAPVVPPAPKVETKKEEPTELVKETVQKSMQPVLDILKSFGDRNFEKLLQNLYDDGIIIYGYYSHSGDAVVKSDVLDTYDIDAMLQDAAEALPKEDKDEFEYYSFSFEVVDAISGDSLIEDMTPEEFVNYLKPYIMKIRPEVYDKAQLSLFPEENQIKYSWSRTDSNSYEVSSKGDKRFSALVAKLKDGRTIEEAYQLDVKGYRSKGNDWRLGKGKAPLKSMTKEESWRQYKALWQQWADENPALMNELAEKAKGKTLTDIFASSDISQARALAEILNEKRGTYKETFSEIKDFTPERKEEILTNFANKHKKSREEVINYINEALSKDRENVIKILKDCY